MLLVNIFETKKYESNIKSGLKNYNLKKSKVKYN